MGLKTVTVRCPAKVNLFLEIHGPRPDGYHEISTLMAPISLYDTIEMSPAKKDSLVVAPKGAAPTDDSNTVLRALEVLRRDRRVPPVRIRLTKKIPSGAGLGGGSSDAWGAVHAASRLFTLGMWIDDEARVLREVGSDTAFFAYGGWAVCTGRGEIVEPRKGKRLGLVVVCPPFQNPTAEIYRRYRHEGGAPFFDMSRPFNRLEEPAFAYRPELKAIKQGMFALGFKDVLMTGSGSAIYGLCYYDGEQRGYARQCRKWGRVFSVHTLT